MMLLVTLGLIAAGCLALGAFMWIRDVLRERRSMWNRRFVDKRFTPDARDWQRQFEQYERPAILRRQAGDLWE